MRRKPREIGLAWQMYKWKLFSWIVYISHSKTSEFIGNEFLHPSYPESLVIYGWGLFKYNDYLLSMRNKMPQFLIFHPHLFERLHFWREHLRLELNRRPRTLHDPKVQYVGTLSWPELRRVPDQLLFDVSRPWQPQISEGVSPFVSSCYFRHTKVGHFLFWMCTKRFEEFGWIFCYVIILYKCQTIVKSYE